MHLNANTLISILTDGHIDNHYCHLRFSSQIAALCDCLGISEDCGFRAHMASDKIRGLFLDTMKEPSSKRAAFVDPRLEDEFSSNGFAIVDLAESGEVKQLLNAYEDLYPFKQDGCFFSCNDSDLKRRLRAQDMIRNFIEAKVISFFDRYQFVSGAFVVKNPGKMSFVEPHNDLAFVNPQFFSAIAVWFPLTELNDDSGRLHVLPGSQLHTPMNGSNHFQPYKELSLSQMRELKPNVGQAVCYDMQLIHASPANASQEPRIAANCVFTPIEAQLLHVTKRDGNLYYYAVDREFYACRGGDEAANQTLLLRYKLMDGPPIPCDQTTVYASKRTSKHLSMSQRLINRMGWVWK